MPNLSVHARCYGDFPNYCLAAKFLVLTLKCNLQTELMKITHKKVVITSFILLLSISQVQAFIGWGGFGMGWGYFPQLDLSLGTVSLSADTNYDGRIDTEASANIKRNPPGLVVGMREMARIDLTVVHNASRQTTGSPDLKFLFYKTAVTLDLRPVNLGHKRGRFKSYEEEQSRAGRVRVWLDSERKQLLLDSGNPEMRRVQWPASTSLPPKHVYVEGVSMGDSGSVMMLTLLLDNNDMGPVVDKLFGDKASWDAMMLSVWPQPRVKPYIDHSPVWKLVGNPSSVK